MSAPTNPNRYSRRELFALGGASLAAAALFAACGDDQHLPPARVGHAPGGTALPEEKLNDVVRLRTASSIEHSLVAYYTAALAKPVDLTAESKALFGANLELHRTGAKQAEALTAGAGGQPWTCPNPRLESVLVTPAMSRIFDGDPARTIAPSDDPVRDLHSFAHVLETMCASMYQEMVNGVTAPAMRKELLGLGIEASRAASRVALLANPERPWGLVPQELAQTAGVVIATTVPTASTTGTSTAATAAQGSLPGTTPASGSGATGTTVASGPAPTDVPEPIAFPALFGQVASQLLVVGAGDENGVRFKGVVDTPGDNSYVYTYLTPSC